jgi:type IV secretion system protein VirB9
VRSISVAMLLMACLIGHGAHAESNPRAVKADRRIRTVSFDKDNVVILNGVMGVSTMIVFDENAGERIATVALGDTKSWQAVPDQSKRYLFIKPLEREAVTNMTVVTNMHIYNFALKAAGPRAEGSVYKLRFVYPEEEADKKQLATAKQIAAFPLLGPLWQHPERLNSNYSYKGELFNKPRRVADDGVHTYFEFAGEIPAIFRVKKDRSETLVNYRREGDVIIVDGVSAQWTLRNGTQTTCVFNMQSVEESPPARSMTPVEPAAAAATAQGEDAPAPAVTASAEPEADASIWNLFGALDGH